MSQVGRPIMRAASRLAVGCLGLAIAYPSQAELSLLGSWPTQGSPLGIAVEPPGTVLLNTPIAVPEFLRYTSNGVLLAHVGPSPYADLVYGVAVAPSNGDIFYSYTGSFTFRHIGSYGSFMSGPVGGAESSKYVAVGPPGPCAPYNYPGPCTDIYIGDPSGNRVIRIRSSGSAAYGDFFMQSWSSDRPAGVAAYGAVVYVTSRNTGVISKYTPDGALLGSFPTGAVAPECLAAGPDGRLYLADRGSTPGTSRLLVFTPDGAPVDGVGSTVLGYAYGPAEYVGVAVASDGTIFVGDYAHARVLKFAPSVPTHSSSLSWGRLKALYR